MTLRYYLKQDGIVADFVARMLPYVRDHGFGPCVSIGVIDQDDELIAGLVYHHVSATGLMEVSIAALPGRQWMTRTTIGVMGDYPFNQCKCRMLVHTVLASDKRTQRQLGAAGCLMFTYPMLFGEHEDGVICLLTRADWEANKLCQRPFKSFKSFKPQQQEAA
jgi:hypothetical protein